MPSLPAKMPISNTRNLWIRYITWQMDFVAMAKLNILRWRDHPVLPGWVQYNHKGPFRREGRDATLALNMEKGAMSCL